MGPTREKKVSKRTVKIKASSEIAPDVANELTSNHLESSKDGPHGKSSKNCQHTHLTPPELSARTSCSSLQSSVPSISQTNEEAQRYDPTLIEVRHTANKGYALFATRRIAAGTLVLAEVPMLRLTAADEANKAVADSILRGKFDGLPKGSQKAFNKLHDAKKDGFCRLKSIYHSNCYNLEGWRSQRGGSCIGLIASRINHSCVPNVQFSFSEIHHQQSIDWGSNLKTGDVQTGSGEETGTKDSQIPSNGIMMFHALKNIQRGREIVSNYETVFATVGQRQLQLQLHYGFRCDCEACTALTDFWAQSDDRRREMIKCRSQVRLMERRTVTRDQTLSKGITASVHHLDSDTRKDHDGPDLRTPGLLDESDCDRVIATLKQLEMLLIREGLMGIELKKVQQKMEAWTERSSRCRGLLNVFDATSKS